MTTKKTIFIVFLLFFTLAVLSEQARAQVRSGVAFLKLNPGARQSGIAGATAAALDFNDAFYANPAATGFGREWQWSASYTKWISDIYHGSFFYGRSLRVPWSRWFRLGLGMNYIGIPEFDSSEGASAPVSGNTILATLTLGQPIAALSNNLSLGANLKYFSSDLGGFSAETAILDLGILYRTARMQFLSPGNGLLDQVILSAGASVTNLGSSVRYLSESTALPRTLRAGAGINMGTHDGLQWSLQADIRKILSENAFLSLGSEISWSQLVNLRLGYSFEDNILGQLTFGASLRLDDQMSPAQTLLPGRNNALRLDMSANQGSDFTGSPYHGTASHFPIGPEAFRLIGPDFGAVLESDDVVLAWEATVDRDLYDDIRYRLLVTGDSLKILRALANATSQKSELFYYQLANDRSFLVNEELTTQEWLLAQPKGGEYYWAVLVYDLDKHTRFAESARHRFGKFTMTSPELRITGIDFAYSPWITTDDYQGILKLTVSNAGNRTGRGFMLSVNDSAGSSLTSTDILITNDSPAAQQIALLPVPDLLPGQSTQLETPWSTLHLGLHSIILEITEPNAAADGATAGVQGRAEFYTIPKGTFSTGDTVLTQTITNISYELPYVGKVFFAPNSSEVLPRFIKDWVIEPLLVTLAQRLQENRNIEIILQGTSDPNSEEATTGLATSRAYAIRDSLVKRGVMEQQISVLPGEKLSPRKVPQDPIDATRVFEERRRVDIVVAEELESELFRPLKASFNERAIAPVIFASNVVGVVPIRNGHIELQDANILESFDVSGHLAGARLVHDIEWRYHETSINDEKDWRETNADYSLVLEDSLGREFRSHPQSVYLQTKSINRERMYFGVAKFAQAEPLYSFYWENLLARVPGLLERGARLRFIGHACEIGSEQINMDLSQKRARLFHERFLHDVKEVYPNLYDDIKNRLDQPEAKGETTPFGFKGAKGELIILGDNDLPTGRQLNRRVMALIYVQD